MTRSTDEDELPARAARIIAALDSVEMDFTGSAGAFGYNGGRDLSRLAEDARRHQGPGLFCQISPNPQASHR